MDIEKLNTLNQIYNTLRLIETKDQNTIFMSNCLVSLKTFIDEEVKQLNETKSGDNVDSK